MPMAIFNYWAEKKGMDGKHKFSRSLSSYNGGVFKFYYFIWNKKKKQILWYMI